MSSGPNIHTLNSPPSGRDSPPPPPIQSDLRTRPGGRRLGDGTEPDQPARQWNGRCCTACTDLKNYFGSINYRERGKELGGIFLRALFISAIFATLTFAFNGGGMTVRGFAANVVSSALELTVVMVALKSLQRVFSDPNKTNSKKFAQAMMIATVAFFAIAGTTALYGTMLGVPLTTSSVFMAALTKGLVLSISFATVYALAKVSRDSDLAHESSTSKYGKMLLVVLVAGAAITGVGALMALNAGIQIGADDFFRMLILQSVQLVVFAGIVKFLNDREEAAQQRQHELVVQEPAH